MATFIWHFSYPREDDRKMYRDKTLSLMGKATMVTIYWEMEFLFCHVAKSSLVKKQSKKQNRQY